MSWDESWAHGIGDDMVGSNTGTKKNGRLLHRPFLLFSGQSYRLPPLVSAMHAPPGRDHIVGVRLGNGTWSLDAFSHVVTPAATTLHQAYHVICKSARRGNSTTLPQS